jgi:hypothetical protein
MIHDYCKERSYLEQVEVGAHIINQFDEPLSLFSGRKASALGGV